MDFIAKIGLIVIAITNHILFELPQFQDIKTALLNTIVSPEIEVDVEKEHVLVISK